jgi:hypothetical protein
MLLVSTLYFIFQSSNDAQSKAVFLMSGPLGEVAVLDKLQAIISASSFNQVVIFTTVCSSMHTIIEYGPVGVTDDDSRAFNLYQNQILGWMQGVSGRSHIPVFC